MRYPALTLLAAVALSLLLWLLVVAVAGALLADVFAWCLFASVSIVYARG